MKTAITFFLTFIISVNLSGQTNPDCNYLTIENIVMDNDTTNLMKITISNSCSSCASGISGCVYLELQVIRTVSPFDTIASSSCWCLLSPDNSSQRTYNIYSTISSLPPISDFRVSLYAGGCGCDTIAFSQTLGINQNVVENNYLIFPNPTNNNLTIKNIDHRINYIEIIDAVGKLTFSKKNISDTETIDIARYKNGFYFVTIFDKENKIIKTVKIEKQ